MHESNFYITGFSYGSNTCDAVGRVSRSRTYFDMIATTASNWILIVIASRWILAITTSGRPCRPEFQHSPPPTFGLRILAAAMGTSSWRASPTVGNVSLDNTDTTATTTFFFATDSKTFVAPFNCYIRNTSQCRTTR
jgi:hypothetical protein